MRGRLNGWLVVVVLLGVALYALAEDLTLTTYYPAPRGVYKELRTSGDVAIGTTAAPQARLQVVRTNDATSLALLVEDASNDPTPFVLDETGKLGLGTRDPKGPLTITGAMTNPANNNCPAGYDWYNENGDSTVDEGECKQTALLVTETGRVGIGRSSPNTALDVAGAFSVRGMAAPALAPSGQGRLYFDASANKFQVSEDGGAYRNLSGAPWKSWTLVGSYNSARGGCGGWCDTNITLPANRELFFASLGVNEDVTLTAPEVPKYVSVASNGVARCVYIHGIYPDGVCGTGYNIPEIPRGMYDLVDGGSIFTCHLRLGPGSDNLFVQTQTVSGYNIDCFVAVWQR